MKESTLVTKTLTWERAHRETGKTRAYKQTRLEVRFITSFCTRFAVPSMLQLARNLSLSYAGPGRNQHSNSKGAFNEEAIDHISYSDIWLRILGHQFRPVRQIAQRPWMFILSFRKQDTQANQKCPCDWVKYAMLEIRGVGVLKPLAGPMLSIVTLTAMKRQSVHWKFSESLKTRV